MRPCDFPEVRKLVSNVIRSETVEHLPIVPFDSDEQFYSDGRCYFGPCQKMFKTDWRTQVPGMVFDMTGSASVRLSEKIIRSIDIVKDILWSNGDLSIGSIKLLGPGTSDSKVLLDAGYFPKVDVFSRREDSVVHLDKTHPLRHQPLNLPYVGGIHRSFRGPICVETGTDSRLSIDLSKFPWSTSALEFVDAHVYSKDLNMRPCFCRVSGFYDPSFLQDSNHPGGWLANYGNIEGVNSRLHHDHQFLSLALAKFFKTIDEKVIGQTFSLTFEVQSESLVSMLIDYASPEYLSLATYGFFGGFSELQSGIKGVK